MSDLPAAAKVEEILRSAEDAAEGIIAGAEENAGRYVDQVRAESEREAAAHAEAMEALSRSLREQADELSREATRLLADTVEFDATVAPPEIEIVPFEAGSLDQHEVPLDEIVLEDPAEPAVPDPAEPLSEYSPGARLLATQMAISGASREMVRERLIHDFDTAEPDALLDSIFGPG